VTRLAALLLALLASSAALAHHGFQGRYDAANPVRVMGTVERAAFEHPHARVTVRTDESLVEIEFPPITRFNALNGRLAVGDRVEIEALRNCEPPHQLRAQRVRLADGAVVAVQGRVQAETRGC
jgi:hypothetical protein